jgi:Uma2 family endonuclease
MPRLAEHRARVIGWREAMSIDEIVLPITEPETEWVRGRALQKMSPTYDHGRVQMKLAIALDLWSAGHGEVATEWRFRIAVPGEALRPLVPDISFVSREQLRGLSHAAIQAPAFAPTVAVEILSPGDDPLDVADKIDVYLRAGTSLVIVVDPKTRTVTLRDPAASAQLTSFDVLRHPALPGFELPLGPFFASALDLST